MPENHHNVHSNNITKVLALSSPNDTNFVHPVHTRRLFRRPWSLEAFVEQQTRNSPRFAVTFAPGHIGNNNGNGVLVITASLGGAITLS